jgi:hypothetical protein
MGVASPGRARDGRPADPSRLVEEATMHAAVGDRLHVHGHTVGTRDQVAVIVEVRGTDGAPPYLVRYPDGHTTLCCPGPDAVIERPQSVPLRHRPTARRVHMRVGW